MQDGNCCDVDRSTRLLCRRGEERQSMSQWMGKAQTHRKMLVCFYKKNYWELTKRKGRSDILREGLGTHWLPPLFPCEHQEQMCPHNDI